MSEILPSKERLAELRKYGVTTSAYWAAGEIERLRALARDCLASKPTSGNMRYALEEIAGQPVETTDEQK